MAAVDAALDSLPSPAPELVLRLVLSTLPTPS
jgi:hypothetical protein